MKPRVGDNIDSGKRDVDLLRIAENVETPLFEFFAERHVDDRGIDLTRFQGLATHYLFAGPLQDDVVPAQIETKMLELKQRSEPVGAAGALNTENLAA